MHESINYKSILFTLVSAIFIFTMLVAIGLKLGAKDTVLAAICTASAILTGSLVAFCAFLLNCKTSQEPFTLIIKDLHKEYWNDENYSTVRLWLCSDSAYRDELLPILQLRKSHTLDKHDYANLDKLDKFLALMLRLTVNIQTLNINKKQERAFCSLGYGFWIKQIKLRQEIFDYVESYWQPLYKHIDIIIKMHDKYYPSS